MRQIRSYILEEKIGTGGFGDVYRAVQRIIDRGDDSITREVAIKVILPIHANQESFIRRFEVEAELIARMEHPHIVPLYDFWRDPDGAYLVMRYIRGDTLGQSLADYGPWEEEQAAKLLENMADALHLAHRNQVIHQDIKPANILLDEDGNAYLTDFGIARDLAADINLAEDLDNVVHGSPKYISPEHLQRGRINITAKSDIYSLGILMYEVLTGEAPFDSAELLELLNKQITAELPPLQAVRPELPDALNAPLRQATLKNPADRYDNVLQFAEDFRAVVDALRYGDGRAALGRQRTAGVVLPADVFNPYKGLRPFKEGDAQDFYGREGLVYQLRQRMTEKADHQRFLAVVGPSGSGKSSVVRAGLIPSLRNGDAPNMPPLFIASMAPGTNPMRRLEGAVLTIASRASEKLMNTLESDTFDLHEALEASLAEGSEMLLLVDQFEEAFTLTNGEAIRSHFLQTLYDAVTHPNSRLRLIVTLRADFLDRPLNYPGWGALFQARTELVPPMRDEELRAAIEKPAERAGLILEDALVDLLIADVRNQGGALPLLQYTLSELYERRDHLELTSAAYRGLGGVAGALAKRADEIYDELPANQQAITARIFPRLVRLGEGTEDTRRRVLLADLFASEDDVHPVRETVDAFADYRLLTTASDPEMRRPTVEIAHEALIRRWKRLQEWLNANRDALRTQGRLSVATTQWLENNMDESFLATGARLASFRELLENDIISLNTSEQAYLQTSINKQTEQEWARLRRFRRVLALAIVAMVAAVLAASFWAQAEVARNTAVAERDRADEAAAVARAGELAASAALLTEDSPDLALLLGLESLAVRDTYESRNGLLSVLQSNPRLEAYFNGHRDNLRAIAVNADQTRMVSGGLDTRVILWDLQTGQAIAILTQHDGIVRDVAFSPDGSRFACVAQDGRVLIASGEDGEILQNVPWDGRIGRVLAYDPSGERLAVANTDGQVRIIDAATGEISDEFQAHDEPVYALAFSPDGALLATGSQDQTIVLWDAETWEPIRTLEGHENWVMALAFSPDGTQLASGSNDEVARLWDVETGDLLANFGGHRGPVRQVAFREDGRALLTGGLDAFFLLWDVSGRDSLGGIRSAGNVPIYDFAWNGNTLYFVGEHRAVLEMTLIPQERFGAVLGQQTEGINAIAYLPGGQQIASAGGNESGFDISLWDATSGEAQSLVLHTGSVTGLASSGDLLLSAGVDQRLGIWQAGELVTSYTVDNSIFSLAAYENLAALGLNNGTILLWRKDADSSEWSQVMTLNEHTQRVSALAFSPDGSRLASGDAAGTLIFWDVETGETLASVDTAHGGALEALAYHPNGEVLVSGGRDNLIRRWDAADFMSIGEPMTEHSARITALAFSPDGSMMASGSYDYHVRLWDTTAWRTLGQPFALHENFITEVAFSPDGSQVASGDLGGTLVTWRTSIADWSQTACSIVNRDFNPTEMQQYFSELFPLVEVCGG